MKIYDCTTFFEEKMMLEVRFNILDEYVEKFIVVESLYSHSGQEKKLNFDINNYPKFKDKIIYLVIDKEPHDIIENQNMFDNPEIKRHNSLKRIELSYNYMLNAITEASEDDLIILSDNDEIPNLNSKQFKDSKKDIYVFKQLFFYYKFNLLYDIMPWFGSKACKKKYLKSFSWLRNIKNKKYPFWRVDTYFSNFKNTNLEIINDGGWHFTNIKKPKDMYIKMKNFGHHDEFDLSGLTIKDIEDRINKKQVFYNHFADKKNQKKWDYDYKLKKINNNLLPSYLQNNLETYKEWFD
jgi:beta-1,4-mannosyl-glycoprotein beta-1,4-N-acetylglucosaminyltransferase